MMNRDLTSDKHGVSINCVGLCGRGENCSVVSPDDKDGAHKGGSKTILYITNII